MKNINELRTVDILTNQELVSTFKCGNMGGMRRSKATNTLTLISDHTKSLYGDRWKGDILHYTGMGQSGDQSLYYAQNRTLAESNFNGVDVHLFEVIESAKYIYRGRVKLADKPYSENQTDSKGKTRLVWIFPLVTI